MPDRPLPPTIEDPLVADRTALALEALERGWALTPLNGKVPRLDSWNKRDFPTKEEIVVWAKAGNLGLRTGGISGGLCVIDEDTAKGGCIELEGEIPPTVTVLTGRGRHFYFSVDTEVRNTASKIGSNIDSRGEGGQVVYPGSVHPTTGTVYAFAPGRAPGEVALAPLPRWLFDSIRPRERQRPEEIARPADHPVAPNSALPQGLPRYLQRAIDSEIQAVRSAPDGARNDTLNVAAFNLGQLVAGGALPETLVLDSLRSAAEGAGLGSGEIEATIRSAFSAALSSPRGIPEPAVRPKPVSVSNGTPSEPDTTPIIVDARAAPDELPEVLIPGFYFDAANNYIEVGNDDFVESFLSAMPNDLVYRRMGSAGELVGDRGRKRFLEYNANRLRVIVDRNVRLVKWVRRKGDAVSVKIFQPCSNDLAFLIMDFAGNSDRVRELKHVGQYPVFLGDSFELSAPGWNADHGVFYDQPPELEEVTSDLSEELVRATLEDLVVDFPFKSDASKHNFFGLMLTPLLRPALRGNTPLHLIQSPIERTGKSKLAGDVFGITITGRQTSSIQMSGTDDEIDKRIIGLLRRGDTLVHIDNVREFVDSASIASLLTSPEYSGRILGKSEITSAPNNITLVATGNNVKATGEIVKRTMPIVLSPKTDCPEERNDFRHPDLNQYLTESRAYVLSALISAVTRWRDTSRELASPPLGGFERWSQVIGGVLQCAGFTEWRSNYRAWTRAADSQGEDMRAFVEEWLRVHGAASVTAADLLRIAEDLGVFSRVLRATTERGRTTSLAMSVLGRHVDAPFAGHYIRCSGAGGSKAYFLETIEA